MRHSLDPAPRGAFVFQPPANRHMADAFPDPVHLWLFATTATVKISYIMWATCGMVVIMGKRLDKPCQGF